MIVADTNIISYLLLPTSFSESADNLYRAEPRWAAPVLWKSEFRNVLALYLRRRVISVGKALQLQELAESIMLHNEYDIASSQVFTLVDQSACSAYDCEFVALAEYLSCPLITQDKQLLASFPSVAVSIQDYFARQHSTQS